MFVVFSRECCLSVTTFLKVEKSEDVFTSQVTQEQDMGPRARRAFKTSLESLDSPDFSAYPLAVFFISGVVGSCMR